MRKEIILQKLLEIKEILETNTSESLPEIEKDLILNKLQDVYSIIKFSGSTATAASTVENETIKSKATEDKQEDLLEIDSDKSNEFASQSGSKIEKQIDTEKTTAASPEIVEKKISNVTGKEEPSKTEGKKTLADLYGTDTPLINEVLAEKMRRKDLSSMLQSKPIDSLEHAIDINAKFLFVRELFFNNVQLFEKTIRILDSAHTFNDAFNYLQQHFFWNYESEAVQRFLELLRRRFIKDETNM